MLLTLWLLAGLVRGKLHNEGELCFSVIGDVGGLPTAPYRTSSQVKVAALLAKVSEELHCKFVVGLGDNIYFSGVKDVDDPRFQLTFEQTYPQKALQIPWYMIAGNHDHVLNISAQIAYTKKSDRWNYPDYYYTKTFSLPQSTKKLQIVMIDTMMLCWYDKRSGAPRPEVQLAWIKNQLQQSTADYLIVGGHHPVYSAGSHGNTQCLINKLKPLLEKHRVTAYFSGHDHNLQHIKPLDSKVHYFVSGSGNFVDGRMSNKNKLPPKSLKRWLGYHGHMIVCLNERKMKVRAFHRRNAKSIKITHFPLRPRRAKYLRKKTLKRWDVVSKRWEVSKDFVTAKLDVLNSASKVEHLFLNEIASEVKYTFLNNSASEVGHSLMNKTASKVEHTFSNKSASEEHTLLNKNASNVENMLANSTSKVENKSTCNVEHSVATVPAKNFESQTGIKDSKTVVDNFKKKERSLLKEVSRMTKKLHRKLQEKTWYDSIAD